ncbi:alpha/beta fold hydrolase [Breoghania sp.]|uniref:alpha/beta fold hydrolase n=1 Tax=Breoghania sp. TaxID=2065378 RepID=UPI0029CA31CA|nr:alpha/beta fold hydrolase [Breoghania sp.]
MQREIPLYTTSGVTGAAITEHQMVTDDMLTLSMLRFCKRPCDDVVVIIHGLTTSSDMFIMPEHRNLVTWLHAEGFTDVFTFDFRMSNRHIYNLEPHRYSMDDCALYDHPKAIETIRDLVGADKRIHVICHCLGSMSFVMSLFAKKVEVTSVIANSVTLTPNPPKWSLVKGRIFPFLLERVFSLPYVSPRWPLFPRFSLQRLLSGGVSLFHRECDEPGCHMLSLMWGTGWPALYEHENLAAVTHRRGGDLYGGTSLNYHRHVLKMVGAGKRAVKMYPDKPEHASLPDDYLKNAREIETPVLFMTGRNNRVFADSNIITYQTLKEIAPGNPHELLIIEGYGHQDPFMGERVASEVFPQFLPFLNKHAGRNGAKAA